MSGTRPPATQVGPLRAPVEEHERATAALSLSLSLSLSLCVCVCARARASLGRQSAPSTCCCCCCCYDRLHHISATHARPPTYTLRLFSLRPSGIRNQVNVPFTTRRQNICSVVKVVAAASEYASGHVDTMLITINVCAKLTRPKRRKMTKINFNKKTAANDR